MGKLHIMFFFKLIHTCEYMQLIYEKLKQMGASGFRIVGETRLQKGENFSQVDGSRAPNNYK